MTQNAQDTVELMQGLITRAKAKRIEGQGWSSFVCKYASRPCLAHARGQQEDFGG